MISTDELMRFGPAARKQIMEKIQRNVQHRKPNKYHNQHESVGGIKFHSKKEARRYRQLMVMLKAGEISDLRLQPQFTLQESYVTPQGGRVRAVKYVADFSYQRPVREGADTRWEAVVEDVKSRATKTAQYEVKRKWFRAKYGFDVTEV